MIGAVGTIDTTTAGADRARFEARSLVRPLRHVASAGTNLVLGGSTMSYVTGRDSIAGARVERTNPLAILGLASSLAATTWFVRGMLHADAGVRALGAAIARGTAGAATTQAVEAAGLTGRLAAGAGIPERLRMLPGVNQFGAGKQLTQLGRGYDQHLRLVAGAVTARTGPQTKPGAAAQSTVGGASDAAAITLDRGARRAALQKLRRGDGIESVLRGRDPAVSHAVTDDAVRSIVDDHALRQSVGWTGAGNPLRRNSNIRIAADGVRQLDWGVNFGSRGGLAHGLGMLGVGDASVASWGRRLGISPGVSRANARLLDGSSRAVRVAQRASAETLPNRSVGARTMDAVRDWPATSRVTLPVAGSLITSGAAGHLYVASRRD